MFDRTRWNGFLYKGLIFKGARSAGRPVPDAQAQANAAKYDWSQKSVEDLFAAAPKQLPAAPSKDKLELNFFIDPSICDGRFANNSWLQELPDPISKLTWDNAALISYGTAQALGVMSRPIATRHRGDIVSLEVNGASLEIPVMVIPGMADNVLAIGLGYGREQAAAGKIARPDPEDTDNHGGGFNAYPLRSESAPWIAAGAKISKKDELYTLASTQEHWNIDAGFRRPTVQELRFDLVDETRPGSAEARRHESEHGELGALQLTTPTGEKRYQTVLFEQSNFKEGADKPYKGRYVPQWGMVIDLNTCTGCSACVIACQAENNIPYVGKERVTNGRELHWIRIDRYFRGASAEDPSTIMFQPMACAHCETAPCENVCPVAATMHSPEGTNDMVYNRCIGTRYCSNNCPYKTRRYNFFNFQKENDQQNPLTRMQKNPDVSIRFRGVMEKCTYCTQRIMRAKSDNKRQGGRFLPDGAVITACQQACPSQAITFGDIAHTKVRGGKDGFPSKVSMLRRRFRNYEVLAELNIHPRTTYLARVRNPHPGLSPAPKAAHPEKGGHDKAPGAHGASKDATGGK